MSREITLLLAGDALMVRPWSQVRDADFLALVELIRGADVAIANLETVIHEFKGHAQADSGGLHLASPPAIASELKWAGFDMVAHANNHTFDYGAMGVLETIEHAEQAGLILAGSGADLQRARAPRYFETDARRIALVAMAADFVAYGRASRSRDDLHGRPGLNPLSSSMARSIRLQPFRRGNRIVDAVRRALGLPRDFGIAAAWGREIDAADAKANLEAVAEAAASADAVVVSIHAHSYGPWLTEFAHRAIEQGASMIFIQGPHHIRGIELHRGRPIFYAMGNFVFEPDHVTRLPAEAYENEGLAADSPRDALQARSGTISRLREDRGSYEAFAGLISVAGGRPTRIQLVPIDLQFEGGERRGRPQLASAETGARIIATLAKRSKQYGTRITYDPRSNRGEVVLE
jgi:poly-gamma-glutamate synthesis protein (capsule biosynthesis protein)